MNQHRGPLLLILLAVMAVSGGYAAPIHKSTYYDDFAFHSAYAINSSTSTDNWIGGMGNWSDWNYWDMGLPTGDSDVVIGYFAPGVVYLDTSPSIASLTLFYDSQLVDNGTPQTLTIAGSLANQGGLLSLSHGSTVIVGASSFNNGQIDLLSSSLQVNGNLTNSGLIQLGWGTQVYVNGDLINSGLMQGQTSFNNGDIFVNGILINSGHMHLYEGSVESGSLINSGDITLGVAGEMGVMGDVNNSGSIATVGDPERGFGGGIQFQIGGTLTNTGSFALGGCGPPLICIGPDSATIGSIVNSGTIDLTPSGAGVMLQVDRDMYNAGQITTSGGSVLNIGGTLMNDLGGNLLLSGQASIGGIVNSGAIDLEGGSSVHVNDNVNNGSEITTAGTSVLNIGGTLTNGTGGNFVLYGQASIGSVVNSGAIDLEGASRLHVNGDANNLGSIVTSIYEGSGGNGVAIAGKLTNSGSFVLNGPSDYASAGSLVNSGNIDLENGSVLQVNGDASNFGSISLGNSFGGNSLTINGTLTNLGSLALNAFDTATMNSLVNVESGMINLQNGSWANVADLVNSGSIGVENESNLSVGVASNSGTISTSGQFLAGFFTGTLNIGTLTNTGSVYLSGPHAPGSTPNATIGNLLNSGYVGVTFHSILEVYGDVISSGTIETYQSIYGGDENQIIIDGRLTNSGQFRVSGSDSIQDSAIVGSLDNSGTIGLQTAEFAVGGDANNSGTITTQGSHLTVGGLLTNSGQLEVDYSQATLGALSNSGAVSVSGSSMGTGDIVNSGSINLVYSSLSGGTLTNSGSINLENLSVLQVGNTDNSGTISMSDGNSLSIGGTLTNDASGSLLLSGYGDTATISSVVNRGVIDLEGGSTLQVNRNISNSGQITTSSYGTGGNTITVAGRLTNGLTGTFSLGGASDIANIGSVVNQGAVYIADGATLNVTGGPRAGASALSGFTNIGIVNIAPNGSLAVVGYYTQTAGQTTVDGSLNISGRGMINFAGGAVYGNQGTIRGPIVSNASINIGDSLRTIGQLYFMGNYTQGLHGSLTFDIAGTAPGEYDQLNIAGHAQLNGLMTVDLIHGFLPELGDAFDIMHFSGESGTFSMVLGLPINGEEHFVLEYNPTDLTLEVVSGALLEANNGQATLLASNIASDIASSIAADGGSGTASGFTSSTGSHFTSDYGPSSSTPEPGSLLLLGSGLLFVGYSVRRRMTK